MTIVDCISDLHGYEPNLPGGDILVIGGDLTARDTEDCWIKFANYLRRLDYDHIVLIAGNHDGGLQHRYNDISILFPQNVIYLQDSGVEIAGISFYGVPWTPMFCNWHFMLDRGSPELRAKFDQIPQKVDVLVTHGPPHGIADETRRGDRAGDMALLDAVLQRDVKYHVFGHIHEGSGQERSTNGTTFINISYVTVRYTPRKEDYCRRIVFSGSCNE